MAASASSDGKRCSWCGTLNSPTESACSKCSAALSAIQQQDISSHVRAEASVRAESEGARAPVQAVSPLVDASTFDRISGEAMKSLGLGPAFVSGQARAIVVAGCLSVYILITLAGVAADFSEIEALSRLTPGLRTPPPEAAASVILTLIIRLALTGVALLTAVCFLAWIYRAYLNLKSLGATDLKYSPAWAIGGFFVPALNIVRPYQVIREIWKSSAPAGRRSTDPLWTREQTPLVIVVWWGSWLASGFLDSLAAFMFFGATGSGQLLVAARYRLTCDVISIAAAALAIAVVLRINARQEDAHRRNSSRRRMVEPEIY